MEKFAAGRSSTTSITSTTTDSRPSLSQVDPARARRIRARLAAGKDPLVLLSFQSSI
jgi:hypothetical protein